MNNCVPLIIILIFFTSCKRTYKEYYENGKLESEYELKNGQINGKGIYYNEDGSIERILYFKNGIRDSISTQFYKDGRVRIKGYYIKGLKNDWWTIYDSLTHKIIEEKYYHTDKVYTIIKHDTSGICKYYYLRPLIMDDRDTLYVDKKDSVPINFYQKQKIGIKEYTGFIVSAENEKYTMGVVVYPFKEKQNYFYFDILSDYIKRQTLYHVYFQVSININDKICSCDSIEVASALTSKYIYIY